MKFYISDEKDAEVWPMGPYDSRDEAIAEGREVYGGDEFWIGEATPHHAVEFMVTAAQVIELMADNALDVTNSEASEGWPDLEPSSAAEIDLDRVLTEWMQRHEKALRCDFSTIDKPEHVPATDASIEAVKA